MDSVPRSTNERSRACGGLSLTIGFIQIWGQGIISRGTTLELTGGAKVFSLLRLADTIPVVYMVSVVVATNAIREVSEAHECEKSPF
jgi:hypothetical protein